MRKNGAICKVSLTKKCKNVYDLCHIMCTSKHDTDNDNVLIKKSAKKSFSVQHMPHVYFEKLFKS